MRAIETTAEFSEFLSFVEDDKMSVNDHVKITTAHWTSYSIASRHLLLMPSCLAEHVLTTPSADASAYGILKTLTSDKILDPEDSPTLELLVLCLCGSSFGLTKHGHVLPPSYADIMK